MSSQLQTEQPFIPYFQTTRYRVQAMVDLAHILPGDMHADLGSGDGRILIAFAKAGALSHGYELNEELLEKAANDIKAADLPPSIVLHKKDFWQEDLSPYSIITVYGMPDIMDALRNKLNSELKTGTRVLSNYYPVPGWTPEATKDAIYKYVIR